MTVDPPSPVSIRSKPAWIRTFAIAAGIVGLVLFIYWPALHGGWLWDDGYEIADNPLLPDPAGLAKIWRGEGAVSYYPLKATVQWLLWRVCADDPTGYHLTSILLHALSSLLVWRLLGKLGVRHGWLGGLIFAVHPLAVESVAWIAELKNTLSLPFMLLSLCAYLD